AVEAGNYGRMDQCVEPGKLFLVVKYDPGNFFSIGQQPSPVSVIGIGTQGRADRLSQVRIFRHQALSFQVGKKNRDPKHLEYACNRGLSTPNSPCQANLNHLYTKKSS